MTPEVPSKANQIGEKILLIGAKAMGVLIYSGVTIPNEILGLPEMPSASRILYGAAGIGSYILADVILTNDKRKQNQED